MGTEWMKNASCDQSLPVRKQASEYTDHCITKRNRWEKKDKERKKVASANKEQLTKKWQKQWGWYEHLNRRDSFTRCCCQHSSLLAHRKKLEELDKPHPILRSLETELFIGKTWLSEQCGGFFCCCCCHIFVEVSFVSRLHRLLPLSLCTCSAFLKVICNYFCILKYVPPGEFSKSPL